MSQSGNFPQRLKVGGIKLSQQLVLFTYHRRVQSNCCQTALLEAISSRQINITCLTHSQSQGTLSTSFCVDLQHQLPVQGTFSTLGIDQSLFSFTAPVGSLTLFPHKNSLQILGTVLHLFGSRDIPVHGLCTSSSAIVTIIPYACLESAVSAIEEVFELPENHAPYRQEFQVCQLHKPLSQP